MWSFFSRDPTKDFVYEIGDEVHGLSGKSLWSLHEGKHKTSGEAASIFVFDIKGHDESQIQIAKASMKKIKTLRHPNILTFLDGLESEKVLYIATEHVVPLETYLENNRDKGKQNELSISWGLHQLAKGLGFLTNDCNFIHNNVCLPAVFVDRSGEWKLGGVDYMYPASGPESQPPNKLLPALSKYDPPEKTKGAQRPSNKWSTDIWGLGCLVWEVFNGNLSNTSSLKTLGKIPKSLVPRYCELVGANPRSRPNPSTFIDNCRKPDGFMDNKFVDTMLFLEEIQIKEQLEKTQFFNSLSDVLDTFPECSCRQKILPQLVHAFEYGNAGCAVLTPLFKLGKMLDTEEYQRKIVPCVVKLFSSNDRATRVKLLQQLGMFVEHLSLTVVNDKIYPSVVPGFMDSNPVVREHTIKSMLHLAPKLNYKNLNDDLLKHFARLQSKDDQGGIRTNTTVCLGKIAFYLNPQVRQRVLTSAYLRALKDPFPPARQAGVLAMAATHNLFSLQESARRLLPALCGASMDPDRGVRDQVFKAIKCFMSKLEKASTNPELIPDIEKDVNSGGMSASGASGWAGWAVSGMSSLTSKLYKTNSTAATTKSASPEKSATENAKPQRQTPERQTPEKQTPEKQTPNRQTERQTPEPESGAEERVGDGEMEGSGWSDNWGAIEDVAASGETGDVGEGWDEDEDWGSLEEQPQQQQASADPSRVVREDSPWGMADFSPVQDTGVSQSSSYHWGSEPSDDQGDFFSAMLNNTKESSSSSARLNSTNTNLHQKPKPSTNMNSSKLSAQSKSSLSSQGAGMSGDMGTKQTWGDKSTDGWNNNDGWDDLEEAFGVNKQEEAKRKREEKRLQRQKELEDKRATKQNTGALKMGVKKLSKD